MLAYGDKCRSSALINSPYRLPARESHARVVWATALPGFAAFAPSKAQPAQRHGQRSIRTHQMRTMRSRMIPSIARRVVERSLCIVRLSDRTSNMVFPLFVDRTRMRRAFPPQMFFPPLVEHCYVEAMQPCLAACLFVVSTSDTNNKRSGDLGGGSRLVRCAAIIRVFRCCFFGCCSRLTAGTQTPCLIDERGEAVQNPSLSPSRAGKRSRARRFTLAALSSSEKWAEVEPTPAGISYLFFRRCIFFSFQEFFSTSLSHNHTFSTPGTILFPTGCFLSLC